MIKGYNVVHGDISFMIQVMRRLAASISIGRLALVASSNASSAASLAVSVSKQLL